MKVLLLGFGETELKIANEKMYKDISEKTNKDYDQKISGKFGWNNFLKHINSLKGTEYFK